MTLSAVIALSSACADGESLGQRKASVDESSTGGGACAGVDRVGYCDGATVVWCGPHNTLFTVDCWEAGYEGCAFDGQLYDCLSFDESYSSCIDRLTEDCRTETGSGMCSGAASPVECQVNEEREAQLCVQDQITHGACL